MAADPNDIAAIRELVREFGETEIRPRTQELEALGEFPHELYKKMGGLGFFGCVFDEAVGGTDMGYEALATVAEGVAYAYPPLSAGFNLQAATVPLAIQRWGSTELVDRYVPGLIAGEVLGYNGMTEPDGGTDFLGAMRTRAVRDGDHYVLDGAKMFITNANVADVGIIYAKTDPERGHKGVSAFVVPTDTPGFEITRVPCRVLGSLMPTTAISLAEVRIPVDHLLGEEGQGFTVAMTAMDAGRLTVSARSLGLAQACLDAAVSYADTREAFGEKIGSFQMIKERLADMVVEVAAARELVYKAARLYDDGIVPTRESSIAKYYVGEVANRAAQACAEVFGGYSVTDEFPVSIYLNYAKLWQIGEGSANLQRILIADDALGWRSMDRHRTSTRREPVEATRG